MKLKELLNKIMEVSINIGTSKPSICGGVPRDTYLDIIDKILDIDITTGDNTVDYLSQELSIKLKKDYNITRKTMPDGHSSIFIGNLKLDFSSNFIVPEIDYYLNKMNINNPTNMQRELFSRDFTCNSLLLSLDLKEITDPTKRGFKDINDKKIKTCLNPEITLTSNKNRVIRSIYLASKLNFDIDSSIINFVKNKPETVKISSNKTLIEKLNKSFELDADKTVYYLNNMNLWNYIPITEKTYPYYIKNIRRI